MKNRTLKEEIRFLAVGAAGANVVQILEKKKGYKAFYVNLAKQDLDLVNSPNKLHIKNGEGASKNRDRAKEILSESIDEVLETLEQQITEKYIFVVYSLGGGSGSGIGTFLASVIAENPEKKVGLVVILPSMKESLQARINAYEALAEIFQTKNSLGSIFILDNNTREDKLSINRTFATLFDSFVNIEGSSSIRGVLDIAEQKTLLETSGVAMIHRVGQDGQNDLLPIIKEGIYAPLESNKKVKYIGLSQPDAKESIDINTVIDVVGQPIDNFCGFGNQETVLYLAGLSFPKTYITDLEKSIKAEQERVQKIIEDDDISMDCNINFLSQKPVVTKEPAEKKSMRDRLLASKNRM